MVIGWTALIIGGTGLVHIANGTPLRPRRDGDAGGGRADRVRRLGAAGGRADPVGGRAAARAGHRVRRCWSSRHAAAPGPRRLAELRPSPAPAARRGTRPRTPNGPAGRPGRCPRLGKRQQAIEAGDHDGPTTRRCWPRARRAKAPRGGAAGQAGGTAPSRPPTRTRGCWRRRLRDAGQAGLASGCRRPTGRGRGPGRRGHGGRLRPAASSSRWPGPPTPATRCRRWRCCARAPRRRRGPRPTTSWSRR